MSDILDVLNQWFQFSEYDPDRKCFNLLSSEYVFHKTNQRIESLLKDYDSSGALAVIYAKTVFRNEMKEYKVNLFDALSEPESLKPYQDAWSAFHCEEVEALENGFLDMLHALIERIADKPLLGDRNLDEERKTIADSIDRVCTSIDKLKLEVYQKGGKILPFKHYGTSVSVFPTLAQCVLSLEQAKDGVYLSYIRMGDSADGYFGYFIKNNGNLFSLNERVSEAYVGQHKNSRNGRWSEEKQYDIFPYGAMFSFAEHDYKGYAHVHSIDEGKLNFFALGAEHYFPVVLAMMMLTTKFSGKSLDSEPVVFIDSLLRVNLEKARLDAGEKATEALIPIQNSAIALRQNELELDFNTQNVMSGECNSRFDHRANPDAPYLETGCFPEQKKNGYAQLLIDLYGEEFELDTSKLLSSDSSMRMLPAACEAMECEPPSGDKHSCEMNEGGLCKASAKEYNVEFVGSRRRMEMEAYRRARWQLARHIEKKMLEEYISFGGAKAANEWFRQRIEARKNFITRLCVELYIKNRVAEHEEPVHTDKFGIEYAKGWTVESGVRLKGGICRVSCYPDTKGKIPGGAWGHLLNEQAVRYNGVYEDWSTCDFTGKKASIYFVFRPDNWHELEKMVGEEVPKLMKGWYSGNYSNGFDSECERPYSGNSILSATDAVLDVLTPLEAIHKNWDRVYTPLNLGRDVNFTVAIGFSKLGFRKLLKQAEVMQEENDG